MGFLGYRKPVGYRVVPWWGYMRYEEFRGPLLQEFVAVLLKVA